MSVSVMAHPSRKEFFEYLKKELGKDTPFVVDYKKQGVWETCKRAWRHHDPHADYHVVIQDDAILCKDFKKKAEEFLTAYTSDTDERAFSFYFGNRLADLDQAREGKKKGYAIRSVPTWGVAICLPTYMIDSMLSYCDTLKHIRQDDTRIGRFLRWRGTKVWFPIPSLVDHRTGLDSLVGDPGKGRQARFFIDDPKRV